MRLLLPDAAATEVLGAALAASLADGAGAIVHLRGELGAGKTALVRALLRGLGVRETIRSPTYTLLDTYRAGEWICVHVDLYRLQVRREVDELGLRDLIGASTLLLIEWPERGFDALPPPDLLLQLEYDGDGRRACVEAGSAVGLRWLHHLGQDTRLSPYLSNLT